MDAIPARLDATARIRLRERGVHGLAIGAFDRDGLLFAGGVGYADLDRGEPATESTVFRVASISKLLTATLALRLADDGALDLDAPVNDALPPDLRITDAEGEPAPSPLRSLLSHSSGLPYGLRGADLGNPVVSFLANGGRVRTIEEAIRGLRTVRPPGERVVYSNPAFNVVGVAASRAAGAPFEDAAEDLVLGPLGMGDSTFRPRSTGPGVATPYGSVLPPGISHRRVDAMRLVATPMGGLTTTVEDLARFGRAVLAGGALEGARVMSEPLLADATTIQARNHPGLGQGYGLGFKVRQWRGRALVGHDGNMPGVATQLLLAPDDGVGAVCLTNGFALAVPHELAMAALEEAIGLAPVGAGVADAVPEAERETWVALGRRVEGRYRVLDAGPAGVAGWVMDRLNDIRVRHEVDGRLRVEGAAGFDGAMWLLPEGEPGHYRISAHVDDGTDAVVVEEGDDVHLWLGYTTHMVRS